MKTRLLLVDDDENIRTQMKWALADECDVALAEDRSAAVQRAADAPPEVVLLDLGLPPHPNEPREGFEALRDMLAQNPRLKIIVITGQGEKENALRAVAEGAYDFLAKPIDADEIRVIIHRAAYVARLERDYREMQTQLAAVEGFEGMLGTSPAMQHVFEIVRKVAATEAPVLILGESGTGKEMVARAIHRRSRRAGGPFVPINCAAIPETLLESELFGHEKGAFTGAHVQRPGRIENAAGGTLLLDEIGELPAALQVKLLRFLQDQKITRVGGRVEIEVDVRLISATNTDIGQALAEARFREDLYYRLAVVTMRLPPLRERAGDIPLLAKAILKRYAAESGKRILGFNPPAARALEIHDWPGNIREMENRIKRAVIMAERRLLSPADLDFGAAAAADAEFDLRKAREGLERRLIRRSLSRHRGRLTRAAAELGVSRPTLYELIEKLGIERPATEPDG